MRCRPRCGRRLTAALIGMLSALLVVTSAWAQEAGTEHAVGGVAGFGAWDWISLAIRISAVLVVIWAAVLGMRWYVRRMSGGAVGRAARQLQIVETRSLGPNRALHLVRVGDHAVLIGATQERISALLQIDDPGQVERLIDDAGESSTRRAGGLLSGLASMPVRAARARGSLAARRSTARDAARDAGDEMPGRSMRRGFLTVRLARLGRWLRQPVGGTAARATSRPERGTRPAATGAGIFSTPPAPLADAPRGVTPPGSLFERTLADAEAMQRGGMREAGLARGLRARAGYEQTAAAPPEISRASRISELQRAIIDARRSVG